MNFFYACGLPRGCLPNCGQCKHTFIIRKLDSVTGAPIAGAEFTLTPLCGIGTRVGTTDANGRLMFCVTPCAAYVLHESATPSGYTPNTAVHSVCVDANGCVTVDGAAVSIYEIRNTPLSTFSVMYQPNGGTGAFTDSGLVAGSFYTIKSAAETGITRAGYTFVSWNTAPDGGGTTYLPGDVITITGDLTLYAQWTPEATFFVVYDPNGGTGGHTDSGLVAGASYTILTAAEANVSRAGFVFTSWNTAPGGSGTTYLPGEVITITGDLTLYAQWTPEATFFVVYDPNEGTGGHTDSGLAAGASYTILTAAEANVSRTGFVFTSWNTAPDGSGTTYVPGEVITITGDLTLYAQWTPEVTYTVIYDANGGTGGHTDDLVAGTVYTILDEAQSGVFLLFFVLASWNTSPDGSGTTYLPGEQIIIDRNLVLYAQWEFEV